MSETVDVKVIEISGINPKVLELMVQELEKPSSTQKLAEDIYRLREENAALKNQVLLLKDERARLKRNVESAIAIIVSTAYFKVDDVGKLKLDEFRKQAAEALKLSDLLGMLIGE